MKFCSILGFLFFYAAEFISAQHYYFYVAAESEDEVHLIHFNAETKKIAIEKTISVGKIPTEIEGPHGLTVSPDGEYLYVSVAHGNPYGWLAKYKTGTDELVETTELGMFPATMEISTKTGLLYVVNFNLHGPMAPSTLMVVDPTTMEVLKEIDTGIMPHGSRISENGVYNYHVSMMTDELIEVNTITMKVQRRLKLSNQVDPDHERMTHHEMDHSNMPHQMNHNPIEKPTWADPHPSKPLIYVAANGSNEVIEINTKIWEITRRLQTGKSPYNLEVSLDGKFLVVTYKGEKATGIWDLEKGTELTKVTNSRRIQHGIKISPDSRYAFISVEGIGGEPGSVDVIDLKKLEFVDYVETGKQAGGIYFWKTQY